MTGPIGVSVCVFTFNYEKYIAQALDSVLAQQTSFPVEIVIGDDLSTDKTRAIAKDYRNRYPDRIVLSFNEVNVGGTKNWVNTISRCRGKYIALIDGDDYFTDKLKLQKQYDALEKDPGYVLSFHSVEEKYDDITGNDQIVTYDKEVYTLEDFLQKGWFVRTAATFFKNGIVPVDPPEWVYKFPYRYDTILHVFLCMYGRAICLKDVMSVWRKHSRGMSYVLLENSIRNMQQEIALAKQLDQYSGHQFTASAKQYIANSYSQLFITILRSKKRFRYLPIMFTCMGNMNYATAFGIILRKVWK